MHHGHVSTLEQSRRLALHAPWESAGNGPARGCWRVERRMGYLFMRRVLFYMKILEL